MNVITIEELYKLQEISTRSYTVCMRNGFYTTNDLRDYYTDHKAFTNLRNCGGKSNEELIEVCMKYSTDYIEKTKDQQENVNNLKTAISNLTQLQKDVINDFIVSETNKLSRRSNNAMQHYLKNDFSIENIAQKTFLQDKFNFLNTRNVGRQSLLEMYDYISIIKDITLEVCKSSCLEHLTLVKNTFYIQRTFSISHVSNEIVESQSIFSIVNFLLNEHTLFNEKQTFVVKNAFRLYHNQKELKLKEIAEVVNLSAERVRQIRNTSYISMLNKLSFIKNLKQDLYINYNIDVDSHHIHIDDATVETINSKNSTHFSKQFITYLLSIHLFDKFALIGDLQEALFINYTNFNGRHKWKNIYLIKKEIVKEFDFAALVDDISERIYCKIDKSYSLNFKKYLLRFLVNNKNELVDEIAAIAEIIINHEFQLYLDVNNELVFKKNSLKQLHEYAYEALILMGKPSKVDNICKKISQLHPHFPITPEKIRAAMQRNNLFVSVGRNKIYGLKSWEQLHPNFKGGTIRDIVDAYLQQYSKPIHISIIAMHVLKYRPKTSEYSILHNLKLEETGKFVFFKQSLVGLSNKKYHNKYIHVSTSQRVLKRTWEESFNYLQQFTEKEKRLPSSNSDLESELKLNRWLSRQKNLQTKNKLEADKALLINEIVEDYYTVNKKVKKNISEKYGSLIAFINTNARLPLASIQEEVNLYRFFHKQKKRFENNILYDFEIELYDDVVGVLQKLDDNR